MKPWILLGAASGLLLMGCLAYRAREWFRMALSETDGAPSSSRLIVFMTAIANIGAFIGWGTYQIVALNQQPDLAAWGTYMGWTQVGGAMPYAFNQLRRGMTGDRPPAGGTP